MEKKKAPFTDPEKHLITQLVFKYNYIINCRETDSVYTKKRTAAWQKITDEFNASCLTSVPATAKQLKKWWNNSKSKSRNAKSMEPQRRMSACESPILNTSHEHEMSCSITQPVLSIVKSNDCDDCVDSEVDTSNDAWKPEKKHSANVSELFHESTTPITTHKEDIGTKAASHIKDENTSRQVIIETQVPQPSTRKLVKHGKMTAREMDNVRIQIMEDDLQHRKVMNKSAHEHDVRIKDLQIKREEMLLEEQRYKTELAKWMYNNRGKNS